MGCEQEDKCIKTLVRSRRVCLFSINELAANIFCALRDIAYAIRLFTEKFINQKPKYSWHYEVWSFNEQITVETRPVAYVPYTGKLKTSLFEFFELPSEDVGENRVSFNFLIDGTAVNSSPINNQLELFTLISNLSVVKGQLMEIEIIDAPSVYGGWYGLGVYIFVE